MSDRRAIDAVPAPVLVLGGIATTQLGASLAQQIFDEVGPAGTTFLRVLFAAVILAVIWTPRWRNHSWRELGLALAFGVSLAFMNLCFYESIDRIPQGVAVTIEFAGPLTVAVLGSRRALDLVWVTLAAAGIVLLANAGGAGIDTTGAALALLAGVFWGSYILLSARVGQAFPRMEGLALAMMLAAGILLPFGVAGGGADLLDPHVLAIGAGVAILSSAIPYSLELEALRRLPTGVFGVFMSLEPAVAALSGLVVLGQVLHVREWLAIGLVVAASAGAASFATRETVARD
ncbi:MAG TPA: DMT family transporter [Thermoleophilaceae bacterium]|nr:DMT family transporter [Thermoleophilaceae bacterium]